MQSSIEISVIAGAIVVFLLIIATWIAILPLIYKYKVFSDRVSVVFLGIPIFTIRAENIVDARVESLTNTIFSFRRYNPFRTLRLGNKFSKQCVVLEKTGLFTYVIVTPDNPMEFCSSIKRIATASP